MTLGEFIKKYRDHTGMSQRAFAEKCGLSFQYISRLENSQVGKPSIGTASKVAKATGAPMQEILKMVSDIDFPPQYGTAPYEFRIVASTWRYAVK